MQLCGSMSILWHCLSLGLEWKLTFSSPVATAEFSKFAGILSAALSQHLSPKLPGRGSNVLPVALQTVGKKAITEGRGLALGHGAAGPGPRFLNPSLDLLPFTFYDSRIE